MLVVAAATQIPRAIEDDGAGDPAVTGTRTGTEIEGLEIFEDVRSDHTDDDITYAQRPPVGGKHAPVWLACGVYDEPVREENLVHDLEHGTVFFAYDPDLGDHDVRTLATLLPQNGIMAPYPGLRAPVVLTVWERQLAVDGVDDPRLEQFLQQLGAGETAPEQGISCAGGVPNASGVPSTAV